MYFTDRQLKVLSFIHAFTESRSKAPTLQEIAKHFGFTKVTALAHLRALEKKSAIRRQRHLPRSIELVGVPPRQVAPLPTLPIEGVFDGASLDYDVSSRQLDLSDLVPRERNGHVVRVIGNKLASANILEGDLLIVDPRTDAHPGDVILAAASDRRSARIGVLIESAGGFRIRVLDATPSTRLVDCGVSDIRGVVRAVVRRFNVQPDRPIGR